MIKKYCKNKLEINIENCLMKKKIKKREYGRIRYELMSEEEKWSGRYQKKYIS